MIRSYESELCQLIEKHYAPFGEARGTWQPAIERYRADAKEARAQTERGIREYFAVHPDEVKPDYFALLVQPCLKRAEHDTQAWYDEQVRRVV